jgi:hypothetical protein
MRKEPLETNCTGQNSIAATAHHVVRTRDVPYKTSVSIHVERWRYAYMCRCNQIDHARLRFTYSVFMYTLCDNHVFNGRSSRWYANHLVIYSLQQFPTKKYTVTHAQNRVYEGCFSIYILKRFAAQVKCTICTKIDSLWMVCHHCIRTLSLYNPVLSTHTSTRHSLHSTSQCLPSPAQLFQRITKLP